MTALLIRLVALLGLSYVIGLFVPERRPHVRRPLPPPTVTIEPPVLLLEHQR